MVISLLAITLTPAGAAGAHRTELTATTVVSGSRTASIQVHLSHDARINADDPMRRRGGANPGIRIDGPGRYAGVILVRDDWEGGVHPWDFFVAGRWGLCEEAGCEPGARVVNDVRGLERDRRDRAILPAGDYTLHIVADDAPVTVTLTLVGAPRGRTVVHPTGAPMVDFDAPAADPTDVNAGSNVHSAGASFEAGRIGFSASLMYVRAKQALDPFSGGVCQIDSPGGPPEPFGYGPHCFALTRAGLGPGFYLLNRSINDHTLAMLPLFVYGDQFVQPPNVDGTRGLGAWAATPYELTEFRFMGLFVRVA